MAESTYVGSAVKSLQLVPVLLFEGLAFNLHHFGNSVGDPINSCNATDRQRWILELVFLLVYGSTTLRSTVSWEAFFINNTSLINSYLFFCFFPIPQLCRKTYLWDHTIYHISELRGKDGKSIHCHHCSAKHPPQCEVIGNYWIDLTAPQHQGVSLTPWDHLRQLNSNQLFLVSFLTPST